MNGNIRSEPQLSAAIDYLLTSAVSGFNEADLLKSAGVGVVVTAEEIQQQVCEVINKHKSEIMKQRYSFNSGKLLGEVKSRLKWADGAAIKRELDLRMMLLLGPKTIDDIRGGAKQAEENGPKRSGRKNLDQEAAVKDKEKACDKETIKKLYDKETNGANSIDELMRNKTNFHKVGENYKTDGYIITPNTMKLLKKHVEDVKGKVVTRFPPEPNGILHIGHAKAINIDFGYAKAHGGICYLRFDDTNPENEDEKFVKNIEEMVKWLGYSPYKITHSSDYFDQLYEWAVVLIKKDLAYVCHQTVDEMRGFDVAASPWRNRPVEESLRLFEVIVIFAL
ncbi:unnamed protein product, partial [Gongylonema pulchrum]|uniref:Glutaminyl-tRNA synthetase n=1 Tax=Gongylonema pulchrum TaxID=637853 RepID=A0A183E3N2_9BILA